MPRRVDDTPVKTFTYWLEPIKECSYAWIVLDSHGRFTTISDYGNYGYWWVNWGDGDFRDFVRDNLCKDPNYTAGKLGMDRGKVFQAEETRKNVRERIMKEIPRKDRSDELALLSSIDSEVAYAMWHRQTALEDLSELACYDFTPHTYLFVQLVMPRLKVLLDEERRVETAILVRDGTTP